MSRTERREEVASGVIMALRPAYSTSAMTMGGHFIKVMDGDGPTKLRAMAMASVSDSARSQPRRAGTCAFLEPAAMILPACCRPASPQYHMLNGCVPW